MKERTVEFQQFIHHVPLNADGFSLDADIKLDKEYDDLRHTIKKRIRRNKNYGRRKEGDL